MNRLHRTLGMALLSGFLSLPLVASAADGFQEVSPDQVEKMLGAPDVRIYDVNDAAMYGKNHVPGAIHLGRQKLESILPADKTAKVVFYCSGPL